MRKWRSFKRIIKYFGLSGLSVATRQLISEGEYLGCVKTKLLPHSIYFRSNTTDISIYRQIFVNCEYDFPVAIEPKFIVDAGANVGYSAIYLSRKFPGAKIVAIEPEPTNFDLLCRNVAPYKNIVPIKKALWHNCDGVDLFSPPSGKTGAQKDGFHVALGCDVGSNTFKVESISIDEILRSFGVDTIDILKIDVEGAERDIFAHSQTWIDRVSIIASEMHDRIVPGCTRAFYNATNSFPFEYVKGENIFVGRVPFGAPRT